MKHLSTRAFIALSLSLTCCVHHPTYEPYDRVVEPTPVIENSIVKSVPTREVLSEPTVTAEVKVEPLAEQMSDAFDEAEIKDEKSSLRANNGSRIDNEEVFMAAWQGCNETFKSDAASRMDCYMALTEKHVQHD